MMRVSWHAESWRCTAFLSFSKFDQSEDFLTQTIRSQYVLTNEEAHQCSLSNTMIHQSWFACCCIYPGRCSAGWRPLQSGPGDWRLDTRGFTKSSMLLLDLFRWARICNRRSKSLYRVLEKTFYWRKLNLKRPILNSKELWKILTERNFKLENLKCNLEK